MTEVSRWGTNQLRDFVRVLKFRAVDLDDRIRIAIENFSSGFDNRAGSFDLDPGRLFPWFRLVSVFPFP
jgi:hypothetical protein